MTLGSLVGEDLRELEDLGLIPPEVTQEAHVGREDAMKLMTDGGESLHQQQQSNTGDDHDHDLGDGLATHAPWFDAMMEGSLLGQLTRDRRVHHARMTRQLGGVTVEWEIVEWTDDARDDDAGADNVTAGKNTAGSGADDPKDGNNAADTSNVGGDIPQRNVGGGNNGDNGSTKRKIGEMQEGGEEKSRTHQATVEDEATGDVEMKG